MTAPTPVTPPADEREALAEVLAAHAWDEHSYDDHAAFDAMIPRWGYRCSCGTFVKGPAAHRAHLDAALAPIVAEHTEAAVEAAKREHRREWADWLSNWSGAVCPEPPSVQAVIEWLRADSLPFGCSANPDAGGES